MTARNLIRSALANLANLALADDRMHTHRSQCLDRKTGSYVVGLDGVEDTEVFLLSLDWTEVPASEVPGSIPVCRYFKATIPAGYAEAYKNACTVSEAIEAGFTLRIEAGHKPSPETGNPRGLRVYAKDSRPVPTREIWLGLGPAQDVEGLVPWFWHPGAPTAPLAGEDRVRAAEVIEALPLDAPDRELWWGWLHDVGVHFAQ